ncbi:hypothetical protein [Pseudaestuariivita rosea]|uniref:hypothetical protein n=1 Tax=Pseudaestuariivita rosea TaxID=2763263 RepID=UPI001ABA7929|nr:hypothetical protein [Pseudaestuariivita rosea]
MIRTIYLHGALGKAFGREFRFAIDTPAEAVRALCTLVEGFEAHVRDRLYQVFRGAEVNGRDQSPQELHIAFAAEETELHIVPRARRERRRVGQGYHWRGSDRCLVYSGRWSGLCHSLDTNGRGDGPGRHLADPAP